MVSIALAAAIRTPASGRTAVGQQVFQRLRRGGLLVGRTFAAIKRQRTPLELIAAAVRCLHPQRMQTSGRSLSNPLRGVIFTVVDIRDLQLCRFCPRPGG
jgi:hypothetical protein